jgi:hypothetical protein
MAIQTDDLLFHALSNFTMQSKFLQQDIAGVQMVDQDFEIFKRP